MCCPVLRVAGRRQEHHPQRCEVGALQGKKKKRKEKEHECLRNISNWSCIKQREAWKPHKLQSKTQAAPVINYIKSSLEGKYMSAFNYEWIVIVEEAWADYERLCTYTASIAGMSYRPTMLNSLIFHNFLCYCGGFGEGMCLKMCQQALLYRQQRIYSRSVRTLSCNGSNSINTKCSEL